MKKAIQIDLACPLNASKILMLKITNHIILFMGCLISRAYNNGKKPRNKKRAEKALLLPVKDLKGVIKPLIANKLKFISAKIAIMFAIIRVFLLSHLIRLIQIKKIITKTSWPKTITPRVVIPSMRRAIKYTVIRIAEQINIPSSFLGKRWFLARFTKRIREDTDSNITIDDKPTSLMLESKEVLKLDATSKKPKAITAIPGNLTEWSNIVIPPC
jgi:hypothetical protein